MVAGEAGRETGQRVDDPQIRRAEHDAGVQHGSDVRIQLSRREVATQKGVTLDFCEGDRHPPQGRRPAHAVEGSVKVSEQAVERLAIAAPGQEGQPNGAVADDEPTEHGATRHTAVDRLLAMLGEEAPVLFPGLVNDFLEDGARLVETIRRSLADARPEELRRAAHTLKSTALNFRAEGLARHCREIEKHARSGDLEAARQHESALSAEYQAVQAEFEEMLEG